MSWSLAAFPSDTELQQLQHANLLTTLPDAQAGIPVPAPGTAEATRCPCLSTQGPDSDSHPWARGEVMGPCLLL